MNLKKCIIAIITVIIIIIVALIILMQFDIEKDENKMHQVTNEEYEEFLSNLQLNTVNIVKDRDTFFTVASCVDKYLINIYNENAQNIYELIDQTYIDKFSISQSNVLNKVDNYSELQIFSPKKMYELNENETFSVYYVYGKIRDDAMEEIMPESDFYVTVKLDKVNRTFSIMPEGYMFSNKLNNTVENNQVVITLNEYINYYNKCEIYLVVENNSKKEFDLSKEIKLEYYEDEFVGNLLNEESLIIKSGEKKQIKLSFENEAKTPKTLIMQNNIKLSVITDFENKR